MSNVFVSIITINFNNSTGLYKTIQSVVSQDYPFFEYIVIDGGSTDGSIDVVKLHEDKITYWVSEKDNGIYHAMNKGVLKASGDYVIFINSGDLLVDGILSKLFCGKLYGFDFLCGGCYLTDENGIVVRERIVRDKLDLRFFSKGSISHPSTFIRLDLLKNNQYREDYKIVSDWIFFFEEIALRKRSYMMIDECVSYFYLTGISSHMHDLHDEERQRFLQEHIPGYFMEDYLLLLSEISELNKCLSTSSYKMYRLILSPIYVFKCVFRYFFNMFV